tara:strand:+ start:2193 stop:2504 length:312 start_codon:yes stop_codon:yes gene_type:complete
MDKLTDVEIILRDRPVRIRFANYSKFRLSANRKLLPEEGEDFGYHSAVLYLWAMLPEKELIKYPKPESLSADVDPDELPDYLEAINKAIEDGNGEVTEGKKKS